MHLSLFIIVQQALAIVSVNSYGFNFRWLRDYSRIHRICAFDANLQDLRYP
jgi:hypothetical protein